MPEQPKRHTIRHYLQLIIFITFTVTNLLIFFILGLLDDSTSALTSVKALFIIIVSGLGAIMIGALIGRRLERSFLPRIQTINNILSGGSFLRVETEKGDFEEIFKTNEAINKLADKAVKDIEEMRKLERSRSEFLGNVSHELRTPIFSVQGFLETLLDGALEDKTVRRQFVEKAYSNTIRLNTLLNDLIDISRIESGELRMSFRYFNLAELLKDAVNSLEIRAQQKNVTILINSPSDRELMVYGDKERIMQVVLNLTDNAIKYNVNGGTVTITTQEQNGILKVSVADTGLGIPEEHLHRIFERFYRTDKDRSRVAGGTGLGLAIVKHILEAHTSKVTVESEVGKGTVISFTLKR
ncbi:MAG TPA: ATP-binding protein [Patescibacteria group bacterium]|nr:ATP-binding protein [Patescibacteria group bacterium]